MILITLKYIQLAECVVSYFGNNTVNINTIFHMGFFELLRCFYDLENGSGTLGQKAYLIVPVSICPNGTNIMPLKKLASGWVS